MNETLSSSRSHNIYNQSLRRINSAIGLKRLDILNNYSQEHISKCWEVFCKFIVKNYESGKGTLVPKFGIFTFSNADINMEGTTNPSKRDVKPRRPVFLVSKEFVEKLRPGKWTESNGIIYYNQKESNSVSNVRLNYAELAYSLNISKDEFTVILENIIGYIAESIIKEEFKNKEMPGLGTLEKRNNILAVIFKEELCTRVAILPNKLMNTKKFVNLFMEVNRKPGNSSNNPSKHFNTNYEIKPDLTKTLQRLRPKT